MKKIAFLLVLLLIGSCTIYKTLPPTEHSDSVRVEIRERLIHDTTLLEIEREVEKVVTRDTVSHLENKYGVSDAVVSGGFLSHSLETKPQVIKVPVTVTVHDTIVVEKESELQYVEVNKLTYKQEVWIRIGKVLLALSIALVVFALGILILKIYLRR